MIGRVPRWFLLVGIVIAPSACDNVSWGGFEIGFRALGPDSVAPPPDPVEVSVSDPSSAVLGPLLYAGVREGSRGRVFPVGEITQEGLRPLPSGQEGQETVQLLLESRLAPGTELKLFHQGVRTGTMEVENTDLAEDPYCGAPFQATGHLQLTPDAARIQRFLALEEGPGQGFSFEPFSELQSVYDQRVASLNLGAEAIPLVGARWPESLLEIRRDLQVFQLPGGEAPSVLATFLYQDQLRVGPAPNDAYSLLVLGEPRGSSFRLTYSWYRPVDSQRKGAPRFFSRLDWDGDGDQEILLEILGEENRWFAALNRGPGGWLLTYQDPCGAPPAG